MFIDKELVNFQNCFDFLARQCQGKGYKTILISDVAATD
jgi:hypothetical protein